MPSDIVRQTIQFQDPRQSKLLNAHNKDNYGRHRGIVLYGLKVTATGASTLSVGAGAVYSPFGTKVFMDVTGGITVTVSPGLLTTAISARPKMLALVAQFKVGGGTGTFDPAAPAVIDTPNDVNGSLGANATMSFVVRDIASRQDQAQPTLKLAALDPIGMVSAQDNSYSFSTEIPGPGQVGANSLQANEVLVAYIVMGVDPANPANEAIALTDPGVSIVQCKNLVEGVTDVLGIDPLLSRNDVATEGYPAGAALSQSPVNGPNPTTVPMPAPHFGAPDDEAAWTNYKHPNFLRDGDSLVAALRRMDYVLRLWMDRTGDQELIGKVQDGTVPGLPARPTLDQIFNHFTGGTLTGANNNTLVWEQPVDTSNLVLKDGVVSHAVPSVVSTVVDTHKTALAALNRATWHLLKDVLGISLSATELRQNAAIDKTANATLQYATERAKATVMALSGAAETRYLYVESLFGAVNALADRSRLGTSANMLLNPNLMRGPLAAPQHWVLSNATRTTGVGINGLFQGAVSGISIGAGGYIEQSVVFDATQGASLVSDILSGLESVGAALLCQTASTTVQLEVEATDGTTVRGKWVTPVTANTKFDQTSFYGRLSPAGGAARILTFRVKNAGGVTAAVQVMGAALGLGIQAAPLVDPYTAQFMPRDGAVPATANLDMGNFAIDRVAAAVTGLQAVNKAQMDAADTAEANARIAADAVEAAARVNADLQVGKFVGEIFMHAGTFTHPVGVEYVQCHGQSYSRTTYNTCFVSLGGAASPWGLPDGSSFAVPNADGRTFVGVGLGPLAAPMTMGQLVGAERHTLSLAETPAHSHTLPSGCGGGGGTTSVECVFDGIPGLWTTTPQGGGTSHNNMQPSVGIQFWIRLA